MQKSDREFSHGLNFRAFSNTYVHKSAGENSDGLDLQLIKLIQMLTYNYQIKKNYREHSS